MEYKGKLESFFEKLIFKLLEPSEGKGRLYYSPKGWEYKEVKESE